MDPMELTNYSGGSTATFIQRDPVACRIAKVSRSREWLRVALLECRRCLQVVERTSPAQRYCVDCAVDLGRERSRHSVRRRRDDVP